MEILAHRGLWEKDEEKNTFVSLKKALINGFGIETDIRDYNGEIVITHDPYLETADKLLLKDLLEFYANNNYVSTLALNIKSDGLQSMLRSELDFYGIENYFLFDMSFPEQYQYVNKGFTVFSRQSEFEKQISMYDRVSGIWMDEFDISWITKDSIECHLKEGKKVGVISSELHGRNEETLWNVLHEMKNYSGLMLCTDKPLEAQRLYGED